MSPQSPIAFEITWQLTMWAFWIAGSIMVVAKQLQLASLQIVGVMLLVVSVSFGAYFALEARRRKPAVVTPAIRKIRFASSSAFLLSVIVLLFFLAVHANHSRGWTIFIIISLSLLAKFFWDMYHRKV